MKVANEWWSECEGEGAIWLLLGKGPSFERRDEFDLGQYRTLGMNHIVTAMAVDVASIMDLDVVHQCADAIERNAGVLLMPRFPHVNFRPADRPLESYFEDLPLLRRLSEAGRLIWYNYADAPAQGSLPEVPIGYFSGEVMTRLLAQLGARRIRTLGVDGGVSYSEGFDGADRLANGQSSFDLQWDGITDAVRQYGVEYAPLTTEVPIRVYIGTDESQLLGARVLEYSIRRHTPVPVVCDTMDAVQVRQPKDPRNESRTQFSFNRFAIPQLAGYRGRAVYLDADMLVFRNFLELWDIPFRDATVLYAPSSSPERASQFSVMLLNCEVLRWDVDAIVGGMDDGLYDYNGLMKDLCIEEPSRIQDRIPSAWNSLEEYHPRETGLIHYTDMDTQPWVYRDNPNGFIWVEYLRAAVRDGFVDPAEIEEAAAQGFVRPSLLPELNSTSSSWRYRKWWLGRLRDRGYRPHRALAARLKAARKASRQPPAVPRGHHA